MAKDKEEKKQSNQWVKQLKSYDDAVDFDYDPFDSKNCLYTPSPYFNWIFSNKANGIPKNASILFFSEPKAGKSLSCYSLIGEMHKRDPEGIAIYFNTEIRGSFSPVFSGVDKDRLVIYDTSDPVEIFDRFDKDVRAMCQDGMPLRMVVIDSVTNIQGIKRKAADSIENHLMGDSALTIQAGLSKLVPFCKRNKILLIGTAQMRANFDAGSYGPKTKMQSSFAVRHSFEYFVSLKKANAADDKTDLEGKTFEDDVKDARGNNLLNGHKIYCKMEESSIGSAGRAGVFTLSYDHGIVNQHEEVFFLGVSNGIIKKEGLRTYLFQDQKWSSKADCANALKDDPKLYKVVLDEVIKLDSKKD
jgi:RecA/RadA recombinase